MDHLFIFLIFLFIFFKFLGDENPSRTTGRLTRRETTDDESAGCAKVKERRKSGRWTMIAVWILYTPPLHSRCQTNRATASIGKVSEKQLFEKTKKKT